MSLPRYAKYKDSGVEWLGEVPGHWQVGLAKRWITVQSGDMISSSDEREEGYPIIGGNGRRGFTFQKNSSAGTLVIGRVGANCGCLHHIEEDFWASEHAYRVIEKCPLNKRFFFHLLSALDLNRLAIKTAQPLLNTDIVETQLIPVPPIDEQEALSELLDHETAKIDALVEEQRRLIELLKEKRRAVISHAVTKGLNPDAPMKPSGIDWLGKVPAHWPIAKLGHFATVENGSTPSKENTEYWIDGCVPWLTSGEVNQCEITEANEFITERALKSCSLRLLPAGTVLVGLVGQGRTRGMSAILRFPAAINQNLAAICPTSRLDGDYLLSLFKAAYDSLREDGRGGNQAAMNCQMLSALKVPVPTAEEQRSIAGFISSTLAQLDGLEVEATRAIDLLQERRSALISAAVTGKMDVRGLASTEAA